MSSVKFRTTAGASDADYFIAVHHARAATDGVDPDNSEEYNPDLEGYRERQSRQAIPKIGLLQNTGAKLLLTGKPYGTGKSVMVQKFIYIAASSNRLFGARAWGQLCWKS